MRVLETKPGKAVSIIECDMNVSMHVWEVVYHLSGRWYTICLGGGIPSVGGGIPSVWEVVSCFVI